MYMLEVIQPFRLEAGVIVRRRDIIAIDYQEGNNYESQSQLCLARAIPRVHWDSSTVCASLGALLSK